MPSTLAHAPVTFSDVIDAIRASRIAEKLSLRHLAALRRPPANFQVRPDEAERDGFHASRYGAVDVFEYASWLLERHAERLAVVERAVELLMQKAALSSSEIESLARKIAEVSPIPDTLADALEMPRDPPRSRAADQLESLLKIHANAARKRSF